MDADRIAHLHLPVVQLNTDAGFGGECHLDANMVRSALSDLDLDQLDLLVIENVGNLVCPAEFRVGEDARAMICSVTEGEDKPLKYPLMFRACELVVVNKIDLLPHLEYDLEKLRHNLDSVNPDGAGDRGAARGRGRGRRRSASGSPASRRGRPPRFDRRSGGRLDSLLAERTEANRSFFEARGGASRSLLPPDGGAVRPRGRLISLGLLAGGPLGRSPRRRGVRAPGDRRQARAAGHRPRPGGWPAHGPGRADRRAGRHRDRVRHRRAGTRRDASRRSGWRGRAAARRSPSRACGAEWEFEPPSEDPFVRQELAETLYHVLWELVHVFFEHRGLLEGREAGPVHDTGRVELPLSVPLRGRDRPGRRARGRALERPDEVGGGRELRERAHHRGVTEVLLEAANALREVFDARRQGPRLRQRRIGHRLRWTWSRTCGPRPRAGRPARRWT